MPRTATVRALDDGVLLALDSDEFVATVTGNPRSLQAADGVIGERHRSRRLDSLPLKSGTPLIMRGVSFLQRAPGFGG